MENRKFESLLLKLARSNEKYKRLLNEAEEEFKRRFGNYPSDIDYDPWIDFYHTGIGCLTLKQMMDGNFAVEMYADIEPPL